MPFRPPTVDEALQYSPLSSIVPFCPSIIPFPSAGPPSSSAIFTTQEERRSARRALDSFNTDNGSTHSTSARLQKTLQDLQQLLNAEELTQFNFKSAPHFAGNPNDRNAPLSLNGAPKTKELQLGQLAKMVLNNTNISFRYPTPVSPTKTSRKQDTSNRAPQQPPPKLQPQVIIRNEASSKQNPAIQSSPNIKFTHQQSPAELSIVRPAVIIPGLPSSSQREEYETFPHIDAHDAFSKKRKREDVAADNEPLALSYDQRQKADAAVNSLRGLLQDIFEAEDQYQPDTSGFMSSNAANFFTPNPTGESERPVLVHSIQTRLESAVQKVISAGRIATIPVDYLSRVQRLCESSITAVNDSSLAIGAEWSDSDIEEWLARISVTENGLQAAKIMLRVMTAGREEKQIYSEDHLQAVITILKHVLQTCLVPIVEARSTDGGSDIFKLASVQKKSITTLLQVCGRVLRLLGDLIIKVDVMDHAITSVEYISTMLIFVENAHSEKDSALGIQRFELVRRIAMDVLAKIFARYEDQRTFIFDEILTSLEKLPVTRQSARQFKMIDGKPIQLVSALLMRLIQTSATRSIKDKKKTSQNLTEGDEDEDSTSEADENTPSKRTRPTNSGCNDSLQSLSGIVKRLHDDTLKNASYLVNFMVQRALGATKTGDQPYRNLLDIFIEDFLSVLGSPDWPAAEILLRTLLSVMTHLVQSDKFAVPAKNMALDLMGLMGSGISDLKMHVKQTTRALDTSQSELSARLIRLSEEVLEDKVNETDILEFEGPHRIVLEYLQLLARDDDPQLQSAQGCHITLWAKHVCNLLEADDGIDDYERSTLKSLEKQLKHMILDPKWLAAEYEFEPVSTVQGRLAAGITTLRMPFCKYLTSIFRMLLSSMTSSHATMKSRSLKSVVQLLEKDPDILDDDVVQRIIRLTYDSSPLVRDSALMILGKCLTWKPDVERKNLDKIIARAGDAAIGVRKRAMKILKDIYLRNEGKDVKSAIADALLQRVKDLDESVAELARQTFEEIWISPFHESTKVDPVKMKLALQNQVSLIVRTVQRGESVLSVLEALLQNVLSNTSKHAAANFKICKDMVAVMFDGVIDSDELPDKPAQAHILQTLTIFAKANPKLFTGEQLESLQPYTQNIEQSDNLLVYRSVLIIFRHVFPSLTSYQTSFLSTVQGALMKYIAKMGKMELNEIAQCLWIINGVLKDTAERLVRLVCSVIAGIDKEKTKSPLDDATTKKIVRYLTILGYFGKSCDFESHVDLFKAKMPGWKGTTVAGLIVDTICPFTRQKHPHTLREQAFESLGMMCQSWPKQFLRSDVTTAFDLVFVNNDSKLERIVLSQFSGFFALEEKRSETGAEIAVGEGAVHGTERLGISLVANDNDGVSTFIAQRFLTHIVRIALGTSDELALTATQIIVSINRQGLVHPKECGPALIALETSPDPAISKIAFQEHRSLHHKHETMFEKEYMKAVSQAFDYQRDVLHDTFGATTQPFTSKLHLLFEVLKTGNSKVRKKFLSNLCERINFELPKLSSKGEPPSSLLYARFCIQNLAFFDYARVDEILHLVSCLEKVVTGTGTVVAHAIETEILGIRLDPEPHLSQQVPATSTPNTQATILLKVESDIVRPEPFIKNTVNEAQLRHLTTATMILSMIWETRTFLRRLWGLHKQRDGKSNSKTTIKDLNRAPTKAPGVTGDKYWERISEIMNALDSPDAMMAQCKTFAELLAVDNELKVASEDDEEAELARAAAGYETPSDDENGGENVLPSGGARGRKRKGSMSAAGTPKKAKKAGTGKPRVRPRKNRSGSSVTPEGDG